MKGDMESRMGRYQRSVNLIPRAPFSRGYRVLVWTLSVSLTASGSPVASASPSKRSRKPPGNCDADSLSRHSW